MRELASPLCFSVALPTKPISPSTPPWLSLLSPPPSTQRMRDPAAARMRRPRALPTDGLFDLLLVGTHDSCAYRVSHAVTSRAAILPLRIGPVRRAAAAALHDVSVTQTLDVLAQLRAGVRFLDVRVSKLDRAWNDNRFWTVHGMSVCVPLDEVIDQINAFHDEHRHATRLGLERAPHRGNDREHAHELRSSSSSSLSSSSLSSSSAPPVVNPLPPLSEAFPIPVVSVFRLFGLDNDETAELADHLRRRLRGGIFCGSAKDLRTATLAELPANIVAGVPGLAHLPAQFGFDLWKNTYDADLKIDFLADYLSSETTRLSRDDLCVIGWTVTPQVTDVVLRLAGLTMFCRSLQLEAAKLNSRLPAFLKAYSQDVRSKANVIFCDFIDSAFANIIIDLSNGSSIGHTAAENEYDSF
jgi:hypothetical protein